VERGCCGKEQPAYDAIDVLRYGEEGCERYDLPRRKASLNRTDAFRRIYLDGGIADCNFFIYCPLFGPLLETRNSKVRRRREIDPCENKAKSKKEKKEKKRI